MRPDITNMSRPVRCTFCRGVYDLGKVEVTARYTDCSVWKAPCCGGVVDDRGETGWKSNKDYVRIDKREAGFAARMDVYGNLGPWWDCRG